MSYVRTTSLRGDLSLPCASECRSTSPFATSAGLRSPLGCSRGALAFPRFLEVLPNDAARQSRRARTGRARPTKPEISNLFKRKYLPQVRPFPKVRELFGVIKAAGCKSVLASSCSADEIDQYKAIAGITGMTDHDVTADDAASSKPSPHIFLQALERLTPLAGLKLAWWATPSMTDRVLAEPASRSLASCLAALQEGVERSGAIAIYHDPADLLAKWIAARFTCRARPHCCGHLASGDVVPHLVQILLPVYDNAGQPFPPDHYNEVRRN